MFKQWVGNVGSSLVRLSVALCLVLVSSFQALATSNGFDRQVILGEVQVPVSDRMERTRKAAYYQAMEQLIIQLAGSQVILSSPKVAQLLKQSEAYVVQFGYQTEKKLTKQQGEVQQLNLEVTFDHASVLKFLVENKVSVWPSPRPSIMLWLVVSDKDGRHFVTKGKYEAIEKALDQMASKRGVKIQLPTEQMANDVGVTSADIWGGFNQKIESMNQTSGQQINQIVKVQATSVAWRGDLNMLESNKVQQPRHQVSEDSIFLTLDLLMQHAFDQLYNKYAVVLTGDSQSKLIVRLEGIDRFEAYQQIEKALTKMIAVKSAHLKKVQGTDLSIEVALASNYEAFLQAINNHKQLTLVEEGVLEDFRYQYPTLILSFKP